jgi:hypothetical protein
MKNNKTMLLNLGKELSRNEQKKILGGATVVCTGGTVVSNWIPCQDAAAYCIGTHRGTLVSCTP